MVGQVKKREDRCIKLRRSLKPEVDSSNARLSGDENRDTVSKNEPA